MYGMFVWFPQSSPLHVWLNAAVQQMVAFGDEQLERQEMRPPQLALFRWFYMEPKFETVA